MKKILLMPALLVLPFLAQAQSFDDLDSLLSEIEALSEEALTDVPAVDSISARTVNPSKRTTRSGSAGMQNFKSRWGQRQRAFKALESTIGENKRLRHTPQKNSQRAARTSYRGGLRSSVHSPRSNTKRYNRVSGATSAKARLLQRQSGRVTNFKSRVASRSSRFQVAPQRLKALPSLAKEAADLEDIFSELEVELETQLNLGN